ncbi:CRIB domain-containing protein RIC4 [Dendrobium catenatum]|uniref:CRIB domain-containing protein n=1 Tax=Dendrobium catenatum TaxID=906689 RepID=A0A2I0WPG4_9ASPA|nr:CRIB domain-containing protein RIC4 [Dendrobium catenatum]PKU77554.1 hypothetical protein MA16_Dca013675 [Dendrobium catenatum]
MRERMERFVGFPFSVSCVSQSSVDVLETSHPRRSRSERAPSTPPINEETSERDLGKMTTKGLTGAINISAGIHKAVMKGIKSFSQLFFEREAEDELDIMEIGYPTDVQHVGHVGVDGSTVAGLDAMDGWSKAPDQLSFFLPPLSLRQFELAGMNHAG